MRKIKLIFTCFIIFLAIYNIKVEAVSNEYEEIMNKLPDVIKLNIDNEETIEQKISEFEIPEDCELIIIGSSSSNNTITSITLALKPLSTNKTDSTKYYAYKKIGVEYTSNLVEEIIKIIPKEIYLDIKEIEYEKSEELINEYINNLLNENGIKNEELEKQKISVNIGIYPIYYRENAIKKASVGIKFDKNNIQLDDIDIKYNNSKDYNKNDKEYIKNLKIDSNKYYEVSLEYLSRDWNNEYDEIYNGYYKLIAEQYEKQIGSSDIVVKAGAGAGGTDGGLNLWTWEAGTGISIFKNGILYDTRIMGCECSIPVIEVPSIIKEDNIKDYVKNEITKYYKEFGSKIYSIEKGTGDLDVKDGYTIKSEYGRDSYVIIRKNTTTKLEDNELEIKLIAPVEAISEDTKLITKKIESGNDYDKVQKLLEKEVNKLVMYDIKLEKNNNEIQPNGNVTLYLPIPKEYDISKIEIYRITDNGEKIKYDVQINEGYIIIDTNCFSKYVIAEVNDSKQEEIEQDNNDNKLNNGDKIEHKLDETPKTGGDLKTLIENIIINVLKNIK